MHTYIHIVIKTIGKNKTMKVRWASWDNHCQTLGIHTFTKTMLTKHKGK